MSRPRRIVVAHDAITAAERAARRRPGREVGGILVGFRSDLGVHVEDVITVPDPHSSRTRYVLREAQRNEEWRRYRRRIPEGSVLGYVGSWHSHPADVGPSRTDRMTFRQELLAARDELAMIVISKGHGNWHPVGLIGRPLCRARLTVIEIV